MSYRQLLILCQHRNAHERNADYVVVERGARLGICHRPLAIAAGYTITTERSYYA